MNLFNRKRLIISGSLLILVIALLFLLNLNIFTYSRYETHVTSQNSISTAVYLVDDSYEVINVQLPDVVPGNLQYKYSFSVSNFNDDAHCDTNLKYRIHIRTTTNVDIDYDLFNTLDLEGAVSDVSSRSTVRDEDDTYFNHLYTNYKTMLYSEDKTDNYTILFTFPNDFKDAKYSGIVELIEVNIESNQILATDT